MLKKFAIVILIILNLNCLISINIVMADEEDNEQINENEIQQSIIESAAKASEDPIINAKSAIIYDRETKQIIWGKNEYQKRPMASTTKIMTAIIVLENKKLDEEVIISKKAANTEGSRLKINTSDKMTIRDLLYGLMLRSGNDCAVALAEYVSGSVEEFAKLMNDKAKELELNNTNFVTPHGLDNENHYTTAYELAKLTDYALNNKKFSEIVNTKNIIIMVNNNARNIYNTNELLGYMQGVNGVKTGFTGNAGRCLVTSCKRDNNEIITVVLGCDTKKQRTSDSSKLIGYAFNNYSKINLEEKIKKEFENWKQINSNRIYINKAQENEILLELGEISKRIIPIKNGEEKNINIEINAIYKYEAPLLEGTKIGNVIVKNKDDIIEVVDIKCAQTINKENTINYFIKLLGILNTCLDFSK